MRIFEVQQDLSDFSKALQSKTTLYRGTDSHSNENEFIQEIRTDRSPRDSEDIEKRIFNLYMELNSLPFRKENTLSTTTLEIQAFSYGTSVFRIFPSNDCIYFYARYEPDLIMIPRKIVRYIFMALANQLGYDPDAALPIGKLFKFVENDLSEEQIKEVMKLQLDIYNQSFGIETTNNIRSIKNTKGEVLIFGKKYYAKRDYM